jgi:hypothetical protein
LKSVIIDKGEKYYTYIGKLFEIINNKQLNYNWLLTNIECYPKDPATRSVFSNEYVWISGERLTGLIKKEEFQFIWGVFSAIPKTVTLDDVLKYDLPYADGYEGFWIDNVGIQHPLAEIEIVAWDSSLTLFISKKDSLVQSVRKGYPLAEDLSERNTKQNSEIDHIQELLIKEFSIKNIEINEKSLHVKYSIWRELYLDQKKIISDTDIIKCIYKNLM